MAIIIDGDANRRKVAEFLDRKFKPRDEPAKLTGFMPEEGPKVVTVGRETFVHKRARVIEHVGEPGSNVRELPTILNRNAKTQSGE